MLELLAGFNPKLELIRSHLLVRYSFPSLSEVYSFLHHEERCRSVTTFPCS